MAATSLWHIKGRLNDLIDYVENPEKITPADDMKDFFDVFSYAVNPAKTNDGEYVSAINCLKETALQQMILTKQQYGKTGKYIAWHGYQSFRPGEVTPEQCHEIGLQLARELWGEQYQIIVTTHLDQEHLHNHFCFNSVSFLDGRKYNYSKSEQKRLRDVSDRLCREYGLSVIERPKKAPSRPLYLDEKNGKPTRYNIYLEDLTEAISGSRTVEYMAKYLIRKGCEIDFTGEHWKMKLPQYQHFTRLDTLDARLTPDFIRSHLGARTQYGNRPARITSSPYLPEKYQNAWKPKQKTTGILALYYYWCYQLGILPKGTDYKPTSPFMKEELRKLDEINAQVQYMTTHNISTLSDLYTDRDKNQSEMEQLIADRKHLQNKIRRASPAEKEILRTEKQSVTAKKEVLDAITNIKVSNWDEAAANSHNHNNKSVLDTITQAMITAWNNLSTHISDAVVHITAAERANWNDANSKKHDHSNKAVIDGITSTKVSNWDSAAIPIKDLTEKTTPVDTDVLVIEDTSRKKLTLQNLVNYLKQKLFQDTGWRTDLIYESNFEPYSNSENSLPKFRRYGKQVEVRGRLRNKADVLLDANAVVNMATLPEGFRPSSEVGFVQHGSTVNRFALRVTAEGVITIARYGTTEYSDIGAGAWINIFCTYMVD